MKKGRFLIYSFLVILFGIWISIGINFVLDKLGIISISLNDNIKVYESIKENNIVDKFNNVIGSTKVKIDNLLTNNFPFYFQINKFFQDLNIIESKVLFSNADIPLGTDSSGELIFYNQEHNFYYSRTKYSTNELDKRLEKQMAFFNSLKEKGIDLYIYLPGKYELSNLPENNLNNYIDKFKNGLKNIPVTDMKIKSIKDYKNYFYLTDHHWNIHGSLNGYYDIMDLLNAEKIDSFSINTYTDRKFYGSFTKSMSSDLLYDYISDVDIKLDYKVNIKDELFKPRYVRLDRENNKYYDYYVQVYNGQYGKIIYDYNNDKENLLIMSDSYAWTIDYLIAASFNKTHVINLRYGEFKNKSFDLSSYIKDNNISKVLFLYEAESIMFDQYDYDFVGRVK